MTQVIYFRFQLDNIHFRNYLMMSGVLSADAQSTNSTQTEIHVLEAGDPTDQ